jgi:chromosome segregation ATPase
LENASLKEDLKFKNEKLKIMANEIENADRLLNDKASSHQRIIDGLENERQLLLTQLNKAREETNDLRDKLVREEEVSRENRLLKEEIMILKHKLALVDPNPNYTRMSIEEERSSLYQKIDQLQKANTDLTLENTRKQGELAKALERIAAIDEECKRLQVKNDRYVEDLINIQRSVSEGFEKRLSIELESIRNRHTHELESSRSSMRHMYETQISFLKEQKEDTERDLLSVNARLKEKENSWLQVCQENNELIKKYEGELANSKAELSLKSQELASRQVELDISRQTEASLRVENDALKEKVTLLRTEIYKNEAKFTEEVGIVKAENVALKRELHNYDLIEKEVDHCILEQSNTDKQSHDDDVRLLLSAPTSKNKRILQALSLGQKLSAKERENAELRKQLYEADLRIKNLTKEIESVKRVSEITKNPGNYLVRVIEEKESEILSLQRKINALEKENTETRTQLETMKLKYRELTSKVGVLETKKDDIKKIQEILMATAEFKGQNKGIEPRLEKVNSMLESSPWVPVREDLENFESTKKPNWYYQLKSKSSK